MIHWGLRGVELGKPSPKYTEAQTSFLHWSLQMHLRAGFRVSCRQIVCLCSPPQPFFPWSTITQDQTSGEVGLSYFYQSQPTGISLYPYAPNEFRQIRVNKWVTFTSGLPLRVSYPYKWVTFTSGLLLQVGYLYKWITFTSRLSLTEEFYNIL